jgi:hypothetical protein
MSTIKQRKSVLILEFQPGDGSAAEFAGQTEIYLIIILKYL